MELWGHGAVKPQSFCTVTLFFCLAIDNDRHNNKKKKTTRTRRTRRTRRTAETQCKCTCFKSTMQQHRKNMGKKRPQSPNEKNAWRWDQHDHPELLRPKDQSWGLKFVRTSAIKVYRNFTNFWCPNKGKIWLVVQ